MRTYRRRLRDEILKQFQYRCGLCGVSGPVELEIHHITPWHAGGDTSRENGIPLCADCHALAHLGVWSFAYLLGLVENPTARTALAHSAVRMDDLLAKVEEADADSLDPTRTWTQRMATLTDAWTVASGQMLTAGRAPDLGTPARIQWAMSKVLTTYGPLSENGLRWRRTLMPVSRIVGIALAERARRLVGSNPHLSQADRRIMLAGITHTVAAHYRGALLPTRSERQFSKYASPLRDVSESQLFCRDPDKRAYYQAAYAIDLAANRKAAAARMVVEMALRSAREAGTQHRLADTVMRASEVELRLGNSGRASEVLERPVEGADSAWDLIQADVPIVRSIGHKLVMQICYQSGDRSGAFYHYNLGLGISDAEGLTDQSRKIAGLWTSLELARQESG